MPRVYFSISSVPEQTFARVTEGYHRTEDDVKKITGIRPRIIFWFNCFKTLCQERRLPQKVITPKPPRSTSPLVDPQFLLFALCVAEHLSLGYQVGHMGGSGTFVPYIECSLASFVPSTIKIDERYALSITPHTHSVEIGDVPEYAQLLKLKQLTRDPSLSLLLNRLALWLYFFVLAYHYGWKIVLYHPKTGNRKEPTSTFFSKFWSEMSL